jgi:hypothetical protein
MQEQVGATEDGGAAPRLWGGISMPLFIGRRSTSLLVVVFGFCAFLTAQLTTPGAMARLRRHDHHQAAHHPRHRASRHPRRSCTRHTRRKHRAHKHRCVVGHAKRGHHKHARAHKRLSAPTRAALPAVPPPPPITAAVEGVAGLVKTRLDAKSEFDSFPLEWFKHLTRVMAYPPGGDRYAASGVPTLAYHDAWTTWGSSGATHISEYVAWVKRDKEHGYLGQFMDDINFAGGNIAGTPAQYADLIEAVRAALGPEGVIEINAQMWDLKSMLGNPDVQRALRYVNVVTKEFNVDPRSGISSPGKYAEYLEFVDGLAAKGIGITNAGDSSYLSAADNEYNLASYLLVNAGLDFVGFSHQSPQSEYPALRGMDLGEQTQARTQLPSGLWTRMFTHGEAIVAPPGTSGSVALPRPMLGVGSTSPVTSVTLSDGQGAVLVG